MWCGVGIELSVHNRGVLQLSQICQSGYAGNAPSAEGARVFPVVPTLLGPIYILDRPQSLGIDSPARVNLCLIAYIPR